MALLAQRADLVGAISTAACSIQPSGERCRIPALFYASGSEGGARVSGAINPDGDFDWSLRDDSLGPVEPADIPHGYRSP